MTTEKTIDRPAKPGERAYRIGKTARFAAMPGGGGPDGLYWTVISSERRAANEDMGYPDPTIVSVVRPATDAEAAPVAARIAAKQSRAALERDLGAAAGERVSVDMPADATVLVPVDPTSLACTGERVAIVDGVILHERVGDPDMCDSWRHYIVALTAAPASLVARVRALIGGAS
jgi:hypothetical protein